MYDFSPTHDEDIIENWDYPVPLTDDKDLTALVTASTGEAQRIEIEAEQIYDDKFVSTATGKELEKIGDLVGVERKNAESDNKLRKRIQAEFAAQSSDTTFDNFASNALSILEARPSEVELTTPPEAPEKTVILNVDGSVIDENPLTRTELQSLLNRTLSSGGSVDIKETGTFAFAGGDDALEGWGEGTWSATI
jgi:phage-related baseplate assembly protein